MRHRIGSINTGLGNSASCLLPNTWSDSEELNEMTKLMFNDALNLGPIKDYGGFDFKVEVENDNFSIDFGYEPAYQYEKLLVYHIENDKANCSIKRGIAEGAYGSDVKITKDVSYSDADAEFKELVNKWHDRLNLTKDYVEKKYNCILDKNNIDSINSNVLWVARSIEKDGDFKYLCDGFSLDQIMKELEKRRK